MVWNHCLSPPPSGSMHENKFYNDFSTYCMAKNVHPGMLPGPEVIKLFPYSTLLSTKFILLVKFKIHSFVGILTFISMINTTFARLKTRNFFICRYFSFYEQLKIHAQLS